MQALFPYESVACPNFLSARSRKRLQLGVIGEPGKPVPAFCPERNGVQRPAITLNGQVEAQIGARQPRPSPFSPFHQPQRAFLRVEAEEFELTRIGDATDHDRGEAPYIPR